MITIAWLTIGETIRKKILWVLVALALIAVGLTAWGVTLVLQAARDAGTSDLQIKLGVSQVLIFIAFQFGFVLAMTAAFLGSPAVAADLDSGVAQTLLARPLRRSSSGLPCHFQKHDRFLTPGPRNSGRFPAVRPQRLQRGGGIAGNVD